MTSEHDQLMSLDVAPLHATHFERIGSVTYVNAGGATVPDLDATIGHVRTEQVIDDSGLVFEHVRTIRIRRTVQATIENKGYFVIDGDNWGIRSISIESDTWWAVDVVSADRAELRGAKIQDA